MLKLLLKKKRLSLCKVELKAKDLSFILETLTSDVFSLDKLYLSIASSDHLFEEFNKIHAPYEKSTIKKLSLYIPGLTFIEEMSMRKSLPSLFKCEKLTINEKQGLIEEDDVEMDEYFDLSDGSATSSLEE